MTNRAEQAIIPLFQAEAARFSPLRISFCTGMAFHLQCNGRVASLRPFFIGLNFSWRCIDIATELLINEEIRDREVRVIGADGAQLGIMPTRQALEMAEEAELDLVKIVPTAQPPVCKLMDYDKHRFEQSKREREMRKNQKVIALKEVQLSATIEEWLMAAEYLLSSGTDDVILCERGIRTYEKATRNTLDISAVPVIRSLTHLPIIIDPSHAVGLRDKVPPMGLAAIAAGADGIIVEVHCQPEQAVSDAAQTMYPEQFEKLMRDIDVLAPVVGKEVTRIHPVAAKKVSATGEKKDADGKVTCAYSGDHGAYAEQAINLYFDEVEPVGFDSFRDVFQAVAEGRADYGMIPLENSLAGSVYDNYDNLFRFDDVSICFHKIRIRL